VSSSARLGDAAGSHQLLGPLGPALGTELGDSQCTQASTVVQSSVESWGCTWRGTGSELGSCPALRRRNSVQRWQHSVELGAPA
jgi:hypothetical protein